jgi:hypothetical protein
MAPRPGRRARVRAAKEEAERKATEEAEDLRDADALNDAKLESKNALVNYCFMSRHALNEEKLKLLKAETALQDALDWLDKNPHAEIDEYEARQKELEGLVNQIMKKASDCPGGLREAEKFRDEAELNKAKIEATNAIVNYGFTMRNTLSEEQLQAGVQKDSTNRTSESGDEEGLDIAREDETSAAYHGVAPAAPIRDPWAIYSRTVDVSDSEDEDQIEGGSALVPPLPVNEQSADPDLALMAEAFELSRSGRYQESSRILHSIATDFALDGNEEYGIEEFV